MTSPLSRSNSLTPPPSTSEVTSTSTQDLEFQPSSLSSGNPFIPKKLSRKEIYQKIDDLVCKVQTSKGTATGFFLGKNFICVPFHVLELRETGKMDDGRTTYQISSIRCIYQGITYEAVWNTLSFDAAHGYDCAIFKIQDNDFQSMPDLEIFIDEIEPGEKVYFGGFPLTQEDPTFHGGIISSVTQKKGINFFTLDGTVVPGNSGGPVFILNGNRLKLAGVISYQIADFSPEDERTIAIMKALTGPRLPTPFTGMTIGTPRGPISFGQDGVTSTVQITTSRGTETVQINDRATVCLALDLIRRNLSTGIGKVLHVSHLINVCDGRPPLSPQSTPSGAVPVMKDERLPGMLAKDLVYRNWYHRQVKGQSLCMTILKRQIDPADHITPQEEKILWGYYTTHKHYEGFAGLGPEGELRKLESKILSANHKGLKRNKANWSAQLQQFMTTLPDRSTKIGGLMARLA